MEDPAEHALVVKALIDGLGGCVEWDERAARLAFECLGLTSSYIRRLTIDHVRGFGGEVVKQRNEIRKERQDRYRFYYMVILPHHGYKHGIFVEMRLSGDDDPDYPEVTFVGAHPEYRG